MLRKYINILPIIIGSISLIMSYQTIVSNTITLGWISYAIPISVDCLLIYISIQSYIFYTEGFNKSAQILKYISYLLMLGTLYLNNINSITNNDINYISLAGHSFIVFSYILCTEILLVQARIQYKKILEELERKKELENKKHVIELQKLNNLLEIEDESLKLRKEKLNDTNFLLKRDIVNKQDIKVTTLVEKNVKNKSTKKSKVFLKELEEIENI